MLNHKKNKSIKLTLLILILALMIFLQSIPNTAKAWVNPLWTGNAALISGWVWSCSITGESWGTMNDFAFQEPNTGRVFNYLHVGGNLSLWLQRFGGSGGESVTQRIATSGASQLSFRWGRDVVSVAGGSVEFEGGGIVRVRPRNTLPTAIIDAPSSANVGTPVVIQCWSIDTGAAAGITNRSWNISPSSGFSGSLSGTWNTLTFTTARNYTINLTVTDRHGESHTTSRAIAVNSGGGGGNAPPVAVINAPVSYTHLTLPTTERV